MTRKCRDGCSDFPGLRAAVHSGRAPPVGGAVLPPFCSESVIVRAIGRLYRALTLWRPSPRILRSNNRTPRDPPQGHAYGKNSASQSLAPAPPKTRHIRERSCFVPDYVGRPTEELPMPTSLQYPLERDRDLERRWRRLLDGTSSNRRAGSLGLQMQVPAVAVAGRALTSAPLKTSRRMRHRPRAGQDYAFNLVDPR
jgi:hypothetical protein